MQNKTYKGRLKCLLIIMLLAMVGMNKSYGQYNAPILPDVLVGSGVIPNSAIIDYSPFVSTSAGTTNYHLVAVADDDPSSVNYGNLYLNDGIVSSPLYQQLSFLSPVYPDVAIGNNLGNTTNFYVGVVENAGGAIGVNQTLVGGDVYLEIFEVAHIGAGLTVIGSYGPYAVTTGGVAMDMPHIDIEAEYGHAVPGTSYPTCNKFAIIWAEDDGSSGAYIKTMVGSLGDVVSNNNLSGCTYKTIDHGNNSNIPYWPDVSYVQRYNSGNLSYEDCALFTFLKRLPGGPPIAGLQYGEWNVQSGSNSFNPIDSGDFYEPKIDAIDNYAYNDPTINAYYTIVVAGSPYPGPYAGYETIMQYNNLVPGGQDIIASASFPNPGLAPNYYNQIFLNASVACGPPDPMAGKISGGVYGFTVSFFTTYTTAPYLYSDNFFSMQTDWTTGLLSTTNYWDMSYSGVSCYGVADSRNALSSTCNNDGSLSNDQYLYACWDDGTSNVYGKFPAISSFSYKTAGINKVNKTKEWQVSPNPATDNLQLTSPRDANKEVYIVADITGREIMRGSIIRIKEQIDIGQLVPGLYMMHIYEDEREAKVMKFVKE